MKKTYALLAIFASLSVGGVQAQTILDENFESNDTTHYSKVFPAGWTVEGSGVQTNEQRYTWSVENYSGNYPSMSGHGWAYVDAPTYTGDPKGGFGPREEKLLTPELDLNNTYILTFDWKAAPYGVKDAKEYTLRVYARNTATNSETLLLDIADEASRKASGVASWSTWDIQQSKIDLSQFQGQKIKLVFDYDVLKETGNSLWVDNVKVEQGAPLNAPVAQSSISQYQFPTMYVGEKRYSEVFTLKNVGANGLKVTGFDAPQGVALSGDTARINLDMNETANLQLSYKASMTSPANGVATIHTNGGDVKINYSATKQAVPDGYQLELFEGAFPPAGWKNTGWGSTYAAIEGDASAYAAGDFEDQYLISPRLDLSNASAPHKVTFTYVNQFESEDGDTYPSNIVSVWVSTDGGETWNDSIWAAPNDDYSAFNVMTNATLDLSKYTSNNVRLRWKNPAITYDPDYGADEYSYFFLDRVLLPNVYGADGVPTGTTYSTPKDSATNVFYKNVVFSWRPAQFADGYKLYVGTSANDFSIINGEDVGNVLADTVALVPAGQTLYWKVVAYNSVGNEAQSAVWSFTTQSDNTVSTFPWTEGFESGNFPPNGWYAENASRYAVWSTSNYHPYDGTYSAVASGREVGDVISLYSPDVKIPADGDYQINFWWGNEMPVDLIRDDSQVRTNQFNKQSDGIDAGYFDISVDGGAWQQLTLISDPSDDKYWVRESFDLAPYAGKTVQFRWRYEEYDYNRSSGLALDNIEIKNTDATDLAFNVKEFDADKVNYNDKFTSGTIAVSNLGGQAVTISGVKFSTSNFTTTLPENTTLQPAGSQTFTITFNAGTTATNDSASINDELTLTLSNGAKVSLPVHGIALANDIRYYNFENAESGSVPAPFRGIDGDNSASEDFYFWDNSALGLPGRKSFFAVSRKDMPDDGINVIGTEKGSTVLMTRCNENGTADDYLVSEQYDITEKSSIQFDYRAYETTKSVLPADAPSFNVLVSETSATDRSTFTKVGRTLNPGLYDETKAWPRANVDLSTFAGKKVYIAIEATYTNSLGGFIDNVEFDHINADSTTGINSISINADGLDDSKPMYNLQGMRVSKAYKGVVLQNGKKFILK